MAELCVAQCRLDPFRNRQPFSNRRKLHRQSANRPQGHFVRLYRGLATATGPQEGSVNRAKLTIGSEYAADHRGPKAASAMLEHRMKT